MGQQATVSRIEFLDILRGLSICFIFLANSLPFAGTLFYTPEYAASLPTAWLDQILSNFQLMFIQGKFYTLFTLLFGIGMVIQSQRFDGNLNLYRGYMVRRLLVLLAIALVHMWFIWLGDIITFYALLGLLLLTIFHLSNKTLLTIGVVFILLPILHAIVMGVVGFYPGALFGLFIQKITEDGVPPGGLFEQALYLVRTDDIRLYFTVKLYDPVIRLAMILAEGRLFKLFGILCLGIVAGRYILQHQLLENTALLKKIMLYGALLGLPFNLAYTLFYYEQAPIYQLLNTIFYALGVVPLALCYAAALALLINKGFWAFSVFVPLGRMALTNYIMQSVLALVIFNGFGLALGGYHGLSVYWSICIAVLFLQWLFSRFWLSQFKQGPLEYGWRKAIPK